MNNPAPPAALRLATDTQVRICEEVCGLARSGQRRGDKTAMSVKRGQLLGANENQSIALAVREELARRRISRQKLADLARISISTLEKALSGRRPFTLATIVRLEETLAIPLRRALNANGANGRAPAEAAATASDEFGSYSRNSVAWLEGAYLTIRPSFGENGAVYAYRTDIAWDETASRLAFREAERIDADYTQFGFVSVPHQSGHIYFVTNRHGQYRMIVLARPIITGEMHGILTTLQAGRGAHLSPVATPIVMQPLKKLAKPVQYGRVTSASPAYPAYRALLKKTMDDHFASFIPG